MALPVDPEQSDVLAVVPARGGSKGIPGKNIALLNGQPLLYWTIAAARESGVLSTVHVSTDSESIARIAKALGADVIERPAELAQDSSSTEATLVHAVEHVASRTGRMPGAVLTLQPTSPLRTGPTIRRFVEEYRRHSPDCDAMLSLTASYSDYWLEDAEGGFVRLFQNAARRRQDRRPIYIENSALYITRTDVLLETRSVLGRRCHGFVIDDDEATDINIQRDLEWAEFLLKRRTGNM